MIKKFTIRPQGKHVIKRENLDLYKKYYSCNNELIQSKKYICESENEIHS